MLARRLGASASVLGALLVPKCPMCVAAWMSAVGFGVFNDRASWVRPLAFGLAALIVVAVVRAERRKPCCRATS